MTDILRFPYSRWPIKDRRGRIIDFAYRLVIEVNLWHQQGFTKFLGLVDSGADHCCFPGWIATLLGHDLTKGRKRTFSGVGGEVETYLHQTYLEIIGYKFRCDTYYSNKWNNWRFGLLGQVGFFSHFEVNLDYKNKKFTVIKPKT